MKMTELNFQVRLNTVEEPVTGRFGYYDKELCRTELIHLKLIADVDEDNDCFIPMHRMI